MKIGRVLPHRVILPLVAGSFNWSGGKSLFLFDLATLGVKIECGRVGYAYAKGARAVLKEVRPDLVNVHPHQLSKRNQMMGTALDGHSHAMLGDRLFAHTIGNQSA